MQSAESHRRPPHHRDPEGTGHSTPSALHSLSATFQYQALWRLAFLLAFFFAPGLIYQSQVHLRDTLPPLRRAIALPVTAFLLFYSYRLGGELLGTKKGVLRWAVLACLLLGALLVTLCLLVVLGIQGEEWFLRGISLFMVASVVRYAIGFLADPRGAAPLLALADLTYLGSTFCAALYRYYHQWTDLATLTLGDLKGVQFWAPSAAAALFLATVALQFQARGLSRPQIPTIPVVGSGASSASSGDSGA